MRIHRLELTAFGPFPGTEVVDFERLNAAGLFLLTGPTGAGKTSILDAICFALYGAVPGDRNGAKAFKSDHAAPEVAPAVSLELTVRGRRLRVRRQPGWSRPSRRAKAGSVDEKTKASIEEYVNGAWHPHSNRVDEVGQLVSSLLGMNKDQFCQVVLLPQGQFQTFLSAGAKERHDVLESLFRTHRFQAIERWLVDHRRELDVQCRQSEAALDRVLARVDEVLTGVHEPPLSDVDAATEHPHDYASTLELVRSRQGAVASASVAAAEASLTTDERAKQAQHALDAARTLVDLQRRHREAQNRRDELMSSAAEVRRREREVLLARRAGAFEPLIDLVADAKDGRARAAAAVAAARDAVRFPELGTALTTLDEVTAQVEVVQRELAALDALRDTQDELDAIERGLVTLDEAIATERSDEVRGVVSLARLPDAIAKLRDELAAARDAEARLAAAALAVTTAERVRDAAGTAEDLGRQVEAVETDLLAARELRADARDRLHDVRSRRIAGMAAELATMLEGDAPCPVCGSPEHPAPASLQADDADADDEAVAEELVRRADDALGQLALRCERLRAERTAADHTAGALTPAAAHAVWEAAVVHRDTTAAAASTATGLAARLKQLEGEHVGVQQQLDTTRASLHVRQARRTEQVGLAKRLRTTLATALGEASSLAERHTWASGRLETTVALEQALRSEAETETAYQSAVARLDRLVADSVFATVRQVRDAIRSEADIASGEALNRAHSTEKAATEKTLADPILLQAAQAPTPDVGLLALAAEEAAARATLAAATSSRLEVAAARMDALLAEVRAAVDGWQPLRQRRDRADHLAAMVTGTSRDNLTKTKLSHYVLAARLEQVVAAANARLSGICGGRYELEHTLLRGVGDARGGLGLRVLDTYTGARRDPATLSGGETFYVSLALALGLADLVNNEIGGAELSTLFVDEGFGTLDADTLDEVMDELDALRSGGRAVGLVSHLAELRIRVPAQLSVVRSPAGSRLDDSR